MFESRFRGTISFYGGGWGFIKPKFSDPLSSKLQRDVFFHKTALLPDNRRRYDLEGKEVTFELGQREGKPLALNVRLTDDPVQVEVQS